VSVEMQIDMRGILELQCKLNQLDETMRGLVQDALRAELDELRSLAADLAPKRTGYLASTVFAEGVGEWSFRLGARAAYASFVEFGTRFMQSRRFLRRALELGMVRLVQHVNVAIRGAITKVSTS